MKNKTKNLKLTTFLIALTVMLLTAPALFARANPGKKMKPDGLAKKTKQTKLTKEKINYILDRIEENRPERAKKLRKLRREDPEEFRTEMRKIRQKWASKKDRKPKSLARRGKGKDYPHAEFKGPHRNKRWYKSDYFPFAHGNAFASCYPKFRGRRHHRQKMFHDDYRPGRRSGYGRRGRRQGLRSNGPGRCREMGFGHGRRGRRRGFRGQGRHQEMGFGHGQGRRFNRGHGYDRPEHGYNRKPQRSGPYIDWDE